MLFARRDQVSIALACDAGWRATSCGYVGVNDGWHQVKRAGELTDRFVEARNGNVALTGEIDLASARRARHDEDALEVVIALAFGGGPAEAAQRARMTLASHFSGIERSYVRGWTRFHEQTIGPAPSTEGATNPEASRQSAERDLASYAHRSTRARTTTRKNPPRGDRRKRPSIDLPASVLDLYHMSAAILASHEDKRASGALIASLSIPWGNTKGDHELGGYHLVWPRDLVECAGALIAVGHHMRARRTLRYLVSTQEAGGNWAQNLWLDGTPYWTGVQMDETAFPILFAELLRREDQLSDLDPWPMIRRAAGYLVRNGPVTGQDRWEENGGYSPFTIAAQVAALIVASRFAERAGEHGVAELLATTADAWNANIERWTYVTDTPLARQIGVEGYYVRIAPSDVADESPASCGMIPIKNALPENSWQHYAGVVSPDALGLVRFGLRDAKDARIVNTVRVIDEVLRTRTATGPAWYRYNGDGYGEKSDGSPFDGTGVGRPWPLLAGERAHYELAAGRPETAVQLLGVMRAQASDGGMLPEQVWDREDVPALELTNGRATGSAMPLAWAHAEYSKLVRSLMDGRVFDMPQQPYDRYVRHRVPSRVSIWSPQSHIREIDAGCSLRIQAAGPARVSWRIDAGEHHEAMTHDAGLGVWITDLDTRRLPAGAHVRFVVDGQPGEQTVVIAAAAAAS
jgi:glucoamylase